MIEQNLPNQTIVSSEFNVSDSSATPQIIPNDLSKYWTRSGVEDNSESLKSGDTVETLASHSSTSEFSDSELSSTPPLLQIKNKNLCLNMIVKNESNVILRLLESVVKYIDCYCICDTGSTDNTIEIIEKFFNSQEPPIPGKIINETFRDFGYNRTFSLKACEELDVKYILLMDADMILKVNPSITNFNKLLIKDAYYIYQGSDTFFYNNVRIVKNKLGMSYWGVTHEYVKTPEGTIYNQINKEDIFINDIGDGGCKKDKIIRDINLLKKGLEDEPNNDRYTFYLANSYKDGQQYENAIETYKKRIKIDGWVDEIWYSYYNIGNCYKSMGDIANAIYWWLEAYNFFPNRIENLYKIINHYRCLGKNNLAYGIYIIADNERNKNKSPNYLFLENDIYEYKLDFELTIIGYYSNFLNYDLIKPSMKILNYPLVEERISKNVLQNYKFYSKDMNSYNVITKYNLKILQSIGNTILELTDKSLDFVSSTPSICLNNDGDLVVNVRFVDYKINNHGGYDNKDFISSKNIIAIIDISQYNWFIKKEFLLNYNKELDNLYIGLEDVRLFCNSKDEKILFNANRGLNYNNIKIEHGIIDINNQITNSRLISFEGEHNIEKNWVLFEDSNNKTKIIYNWSPLIIGDIQTLSTVSPEFNASYEFKQTHNIKTPYLFKNVRGSTNGVKIGNEIWFICHVVSYEDRRYYYHIFIVLDSLTYEVKKYTPLFTFEKEKVEYSLGFVYFEKINQLLIGYSIMDKETKYMSIDKNYLDSLFINDFKK